jgi:hypothetical protein
MRKVLSPPDNRPAIPLPASSWLWGLTFMTSPSGIVWPVPEPNVLIMPRSLMFPET